MIKNISLSIFILACTIANTHAMKFSTRDKETLLHDRCILEKRQLRKEGLTAEETRELRELQQRVDRHMEDFERNHGIKKNLIDKDIKL